MRISLRLDNFGRMGFIVVILLVLAMGVRSFSTVTIGSGSANMTVNITYGGSPVFGVNVTLYNGSYGSGFNTTYNDGTWYNLTTNTSGIVSFFQLSIADNYTYRVWAPGYLPSFGELINMSNGSTAINYTSNMTLVAETVDPWYAGLSLTPGTSQNISQDVNLSVTVNGTYSYIQNITLFVNSSSSNAWIAYSQVYYPAVNSTDMTVDFGYTIPASYANSTLSFRYNITDQAGNSNLTSYFNVTMSDNVSPTVWTVTPSAYFLQSGDSVTVQALANDSSSSVLLVNISLFNSSDDLIYNATTSSETNDVYSTVITLNYPEGNYSLNVTAKDLYNNTYMNMSSWVVIDDTAPAINTVTLSDSVVANGQQITLDAYVFDNYNVSLGTYTVLLRTNQSGTSYAMSYVSGNHWQYTWTVPFSGDYDVLINITATDALGNLGMNATQVLTVDNTAIFIDLISPVLATVYPGLGPDYFNATIDVNYSLSGAADTVYIISGDTRTFVPATQDYNFSLNVTYPGKHYVGIIANDSAGNTAINTTMYYTNFLFNMTRWLSEQNNSHVSVLNMTFYNSTNNSITGWYNLSAGLEHVGLVIYLNDSTYVNVTGIDLNTSFLNYNLSVGYNITDAVSQFGTLFGAEAVDTIHLVDIDKLNLTTIDMVFTSSASQVQELHYCVETFDSTIGAIYYGLAGGRDMLCSNIESCPDSNSDDVCYYESGSAVHINVSDASLFAQSRVYYPSATLIAEEQFKNDGFSEAPFASPTNFTFLLVNDTVAPTIYLTEDNSSWFGSPTGNSVTVRTNEYANCSYSLNATAGNYNLSIGNYTSITNRGNSSYTFSVLPSSFYLNADYEMNITCADRYDNSDMFIWHFTVNDTTGPVISGVSPTGEQAYGTTSVNAQLTTSEPATCRYGIAQYFNYDAGTAMSSSNGLTHTRSFTTANGGSYTYYVSCRDYNNNSRNTTLSFSVAATEPSTDSTGDSVSSSGGETVTEDTYIKKKFTFENVHEGDIVSEETSTSAFGVRSFSFTASEDIVGSFNITIESFEDDSDLPSGVDDYSGSVYRYIVFDFEGNFSFDTVESGNVTLKVRRSEIEDFNLTLADFTIMKYVESSDTWVEVDPEDIDSTSSYYYFTVDEPALVYAITFQMPDDLVTIGTTDDAQPETGDTLVSNTKPSNTITSADVEKETTAKVANTSVDKGQVLTFLIIIVGLITVVGIVLMNKDRIMSAAAGAKSGGTGTGTLSFDGEKHNVKSPGDVLIGYNHDATEAPLEKGDTSLHNEKIALPATIKIFPIKDVSLQSQDKKVLVNTLRKIFKNVWVSGYNDKEIKATISSPEWTKDDLHDAYVHLYYDAVDEEIGDAHLPELDSMVLVEKLRFAIWKKYGYTKADIVSRLKANGWEEGMIEDVLETLDTEMTLPLDIADPGHHDADMLAQQEADKQLVDYIRLARSKGASKAVIKGRLLEAGWNPKYVDAALSREP